MAVTIAAAVVVACLCSALTLWGLMGCRGYERPGQRGDREGQLTRPQAGLASAPHLGLPSPRHPFEAGGHSPGPAQCPDLVPTGCES